MYIHVKEKIMKAKVRTNSYPFGSSFETDKDGTVRLTVFGMESALKLRRIDENDPAESFLRNRYNRENNAHYTDGFIFGRGTWAEFIPDQKVLQFMHAFYFDEEGYRFRDDVFKNTRLEDNEKILKAIVKYVNRFYDSIEPARD